jgi:hypothetical protein
VRICGVKKKSPLNDVPERFLARYGHLITGYLGGFDRMRFMGSIRTLQSVRGMMGFLGRTGVLLKEFKAYSQALTERVRQHAESVASASGHAVEYLRSSLERKDQMARTVAQEQGIREGLIGVFSCVEPCMTYFLHRNRRERLLELEFAAGKCLHLYYYFLHAEYGLMHLRLQTWFPFNVTICLNGREWLARVMEKAGLGFVQKGNCFVALEDAAAARVLTAQQLKTDWSQTLNELLRTCHPIAEELCAPIQQSYYWSLKESEYATDFLFRSPQELAELYPRFLHHGIEHFGSKDVLRFLGSNSKSEHVHGKFEGELNTSLRRRPEGVRIKHSAHGNSIKLYDKEGQVLRVETTINQPANFRVYRRSERHPEEPPCWRPMRKGIADTYRRAEVSAAANLRYCDALAQVSDQEPVGKAADTIFKPVRKAKRRYRALNPWSQRDAALLECVGNGAWVLNGFRNQDVRTALLGEPRCKRQRKRDAAKVTRLLALLRAHHLIRKLPGTHRYQVTARGRQVITALQAARRASTQQLTEIAA